MFDIFELACDVLHWELKILADFDFLAKKELKILADFDLISKKGHSGPSAQVHKIILQEKKLQIFRKWNQDLAQNKNIAFHLHIECINFFVAKCKMMMPPHELIQFHFTQIFLFCLLSKPTFCHFSRFKIPHLQMWSFQYFSAHQGSKRKFNPKICQEKTSAYGKSSTSSEDGNTQISSVGRSVSAWMHWGKFYQFVTHIHHFIKAASWISSIL